MTEKYTAADFANAQFAEHSDGRIAARLQTEEARPWESVRDFHTDEGMAAHGWVPVPTKPQITESQFSKLSEDLKNRTTILACALERVGIKIIPDPEPTNTDMLKTVLREAWDGHQSMNDIAEWLDKNGVTAPNVKGN